MKNVKEYAVASSDYTLKVLFIWKEYSRVCVCYNVSFCYLALFLNFCIFCAQVSFD